MLTANINLAVPPLPDNQVWFANAAAWSNYWKDINVTATFVPADTVIYNVTNYDGTLNFLQFNIGGVMQSLPAYSQHQSLVAAFLALQTDYIALKQSLKDSGFITQV